MTHGTLSRPGGSAAREHAGEVASWIRPLARLGYAAKGVVYAIVGALALRLALGMGGGTTDAQGALQVIAGGTAGMVLLLVMALGLFGYAVWRVVEAVTNPDHLDADAAGIAQRLWQAGRGLLYALLGVAAIRIALGSSDGRGERMERWTATVMEAPLGRWLVALAGLGIIGYAIFQLYRAWAAKVGEHLDLSETGPRTRRWIIRAARLGFAARGVLFALIGWFLLQAALRHSPERAGGIEQSLDTLAGGGWGQLLLVLVAFGLVAYGAFELVKARYRRIAVA